MAKYLDSTGVSTLWSKIKGSFLSKGGGVMSGNISFPKSTGIIFDGSIGEGSGCYIAYSDNLYLAANKSGKRIYLESTYDTAPYFRNQSGDYTIWHSGNLNPSNYASADHTHSNYLAYYRHTVAGSGESTYSANSLVDGWHDFKCYVNDCGTVDNHGTLIQNSYNGTPFQIWIPDVGYYIYKRYNSGSIGGTWSKIFAGYADSAGSVSWSNISDRPSTFTPSDHTHPYLPLSGGTMTGRIFMGSGTNITFDGSQGAGMGSYIVYTDNLYLASNLEGKRVYLESTYQPCPYFRNQSGDYPILHSGNYSTYCASASHTHSYLPLTGGTITGIITGNTGGGLIIQSADSGVSWGQGVRVYPASDGYSLISLQDSTSQNVLSMVTNVNDHRAYFDYRQDGVNKVINIPYNAGTLALTSDIPTVTDYYWANIKISSSSSSTTAPIFASNTRIQASSGVAKLDFYSSSTLQGYVGYCSNSYGNYIELWNPVISRGIYIGDMDTTAPIFNDGSGSLRKMWHEGNFNPSNYSTTSHNHDSSYLKLSGGTISNDSSPSVVISNTSSSSSVPQCLHLLTPNLPTGLFSSFVFGVNLNTNNTGTLTFYYTGSGSSSNFAGLGFCNNDNLFRVYASGKCWCGSELEAGSFKKTGGTSSQFLKADGSVDSNSYSTTSHTHSNYHPYYRHTTNQDANSMVDGWHDIQAYVSNCGTTSNHGTLIQNSYNGTPFQIWIPDVGYYIYKRYNSGSVGGTWSKIYAGYADEVPTLTNSEIDTLII